MPQEPLETITDVRTSTTVGTKIAIVIGMIVTLFIGFGILAGMLGT